MISAMIADTLRLYENQALKIVTELLIYYYSISITTLIYKTLGKAHKSEVTTKELISLPAKIWHREPVNIQVNFRNEYITSAFITHYKVNIRYDFYNLVSSIEEGARGVQPSQLCAEQGAAPLPLVSVLQVKYYKNKPRFIRQK